MMTAHDALCPVTCFVKDWAQNFERFGVIMFFRKAPPQTEGRRNADHKIKTPPVEHSSAKTSRFGSRGTQQRLT